MQSSNNIPHDFAISSAALQSSKLPPVTNIYRYDKTIKNTILIKI